MSKSNITIDKETAKRLFKESPEWFQKELTESFGADTFKDKVFEAIKTFKDACDLTGEDPNNPNFYTGTSDEIAYKKLKVVSKAINWDANLNKPWEPNWDNSDQYKYWPYFSMGSSGFGFSSSSYDLTYTDTSVGSHLCFESREQSNYAGQQFSDLYKDLLTITK
jgi:hypothetical protein